MKYTRSTFAFTPELGAKLRALRRQRSTTLRGLAVMMGRDSPGAYVPLAKLERGRLPAISASREPQPVNRRP